MICQRNHDWLSWRRLAPVLFLVYSPKVLIGSQVYRSLFDEFSFEGSLLLSWGLDWNIWNRFSDHSESFLALDFQRLFWRLSLFFSLSVVCLGYPLLGALLKKTAFNEIILLLLWRAGKLVKYWRLFQKAKLAATLVIRRNITAHLFIDRRFVKSDFLDTFVEPVAFVIRKVVLYVYLAGSI